MITVCVPFLDPHENFLPHFIEWYAANKRQHDLRLEFQQRRPLHKVQAAAVELARKNKSSHILFTEDDHWGFPVDGLEVLLEEDKEVIGFWTISRRYPFNALCMRRNDESLPITQTEIPNMHPFERVDSEQEMVQKTDLLSWAFTLVETKVFDFIDDPFTQWGEVPTDSQFCHNCQERGIDRWIHFGYGMPHADIVPNERYAHHRSHMIMRSMRGLPQLPNHLEKTDDEYRLPNVEHSESEPAL
jgi:hypothetical protein